MPLSWPKQFRELKDAVHSAWGIQNELEILREFSDGKSRARVFLVDIQSEKHCGQAILKLGKYVKWSDDDLMEWERHQLAVEQSAEYAKEHFPKLIDTFNYRDQTALLCTIAGNSFSNTNALIRLDMGHRHAAIQNLSAGILKDWNANYVISDSARVPCSALKSWLGYRIKPELGGKIEPFLWDTCKLHPEERAFSFFSKWYPNPYAYSVNSNLWPQGHEVKFILGRGHGDLHGYNVLVKIINPIKLAYYLIDLALYEEQSYLFYDHAYLELSHLLHDRGSASFRRWLQIVDAVTANNPSNINSDNVEPDDTGLVFLVKAVRVETKNWIKSNEPNRLDHMYGQTILARVAAGLNFVNKEIEERQRKLSLLYAAANLKQYFSFFNIECPTDGCILNLDEAIEVPHSDEWRPVWDDCEQFDTNKNTYVLICGPGVRDIKSKQLEIAGRVPWSLILDFDPESKNGGLFDSVNPVLQKYRAPRVFLFDNVQDMNYREATGWFMASGVNERPETLNPDHKNWRRRYIPVIRDLIYHLSKSVSPHPLSVLIIPNGIPENEYLRNIWECFDEVFEDAIRYIVIADDLQSQSIEIKGKPGVSIHLCTVENLMSGFWQMYGTMPYGQSVQVPKRSATGQDYIPLDDEDIQYLKEDLEIVHLGLLEEPQKGTRIGDDFWRGFEITWTELDMGADVHRGEIFEKLKEEVRDRLKESRNVSIPLYHFPGAGGTTLAKRIAWDLKDFYPTVIVHNLSQYTSVRIERLFHVTGLPVLAIMDASHVPPPAREQLYKDLKGKNARAVFLYVVRTMKRQGEHCLSDSMTKNEAWRFYLRYREVALRGRDSMLKQLAEDDKWISYRLPFFFGLYAFEDRFVHVPDFVSAHLEDIRSPEQLEVICFIALVTRYSQSYLTEEILKGFLNVSRENPLRLETHLGPGASRLVLFRSRQVKMIHPLIAHETLRQVYQVCRKNPDSWKEKLVDLCCSFIETISIIGGENSDTVLEILTQMFISRDHWIEGLDRRRHFSELILEIPSPAGQHRVLTQLTESCSNEAHFWNHLGRHHIYEMRSSYTEAERCLREAIRLDEDNSIHYHALGLVYRYEVQRYLESALKKPKDKQVSADKALSEAKSIISLAEEAFDKSRELDPETDYGYITHIQLITRIIEKLFRLSGDRDYASFFCSGKMSALWCRDKIPKAEDLLIKVKSLQAQNDESRYIVECQGALQNFYGQFDAMIEGLTKLLERSDLQLSPIRRLIASSYHANKNYNWDNIKSKNLRRICSYMVDNLEDDPTNVHDLRMWFHAYRRVSNFSMLEAIDRLTGWAMREETIEAHYYLYILNFLRWKQGLLSDGRLVLEHLNKCQTLAGKLRRVHSFEWLAKGPEWAPLASHTKLGGWDEAAGFFRNTGALERVEGLVKSIKGAQTGTISLGPFEVFFAPLNKFLPARDENKKVTFYLGFSYTGFRGWEVLPSDT